MATDVAETFIGAVVLAVAGGFLVYAANTAEVDVAGGGYEVVASFRQAEGISVGSDVRVAGVKVGSVRGMGLDPDTYQASVTLLIRQNVGIPEDSVAKITATSLLGDSYVAIVPGASEDMLEPGGEIAYTQGSISMTDLIGRFIHGEGGT